MAVEIHSLQNPRIKQLVKLRDRRARDRSRTFLIEGYRELERAVRTKAPIREIYRCPELYLGENEAGLVERAVNELGAELFDVSAPVFRKISYRDRPEGLLAVATQASASLADLPAVERPLYLVAVTIEKPGNLGTMLRTADAVGADAVIVCDRCTDLFNPNVVRASLGTLFTQPVVETSTAELLPWLRERHVKIVATTPSAEQLHTEADLTQPVAIVVGSEQLGLPDEWLEATDERIRIPMAGDIDSLNAAVATAVVLFEVVRQRAAR